MTTCYGYTRVSTVKQGEGVSLEAQREEITRYADRHGLTIARWFEEKETAAKSGRPIFNAVVKDLMARKADGLIVHKIDRSARNFRDWARIGELADQGVAIHFATESLDFQSRGGRLTADIQAVIASDYIRNLREEALKGLTGRLKQGLYPHMAPIGYLDQGGGKAKIQDPATAPLVREMFELYATGEYPIRKLVEEMDRRGLRNRNGKPLAKTGIEKALANPFYCGIIRISTSEQCYRGVHKPLITASLFERVQDLKAGKCQKTKTRHLHTYRRLFACGHCGAALVAEKQKGHVYYRCHTKGCLTRSVTEPSIDEAVLDCLSAVNMPKERFASIQQALENWAQGDGANSSKPHSLRLQIAQIDSRLDRLTDALIDGVIDKPTYERRNKAFLFERQKLKDQFRNLKNRRRKIRQLRKFLELVIDLAWLHENAKPPEKRVLTELATSNRIVSGKNIAVEPSKWLLTAQNAMDVLYGGALRATDRTLLEMHVPLLEEIALAENEISMDGLLDRMMDIFDQHTGKKPRQEVPQWKYNLKNQHPDKNK